MSQNGRELVLKRETDTPGTFAFICGLRARSMSIGSEEVDTTVPNCVDPSLPLVSSSGYGRQRVQFQGDGVFKDNTAGKAMADDARLQRKHAYQIIVPGYGTFEGDFGIFNFQWSGEMEGELTFSATVSLMDGDGFVFEAAA